MAFRIKGWFFTFKRAWVSVARARSAPHEVALGVAIGAFWGVFPTFGASTPIVLLMARFWRFNVIAAFSGALVSNPLTSPFLLWLSYRIGAWLLNSPVGFDLENWTKELKSLGWVMLIGSTLLSAGVSIVLYYLSLFWLTRHERSAQKKRKQKASPEGKQNI